MDDHEKVINSLDIRVKRWKEMFDVYCEKIGDKNKPDHIKAKYLSNAREAYTIYSELNAILNDILSLNNSEEES